MRVAVTGRLKEFLTAPDESTADADAARAQLEELVLGYLDGAAGVLVLTDLPADQEHGERAVLRATRLLGTPLPQNREGTLIREVRDRGASISQRGRVRYSDTRFGGDLHTDGAEAALPAPDIFTLFCVRQSAVGGALSCLHIRDLEKDLAPDVLRTLREPFHFDRRGDQQEGGARTVTKPVLFTQRNRPAVTYLRSYIDQGHDHPEVPALTEAQRASLDALDSAIGASRAVVTGKLNEGELALFDNLSLLHGRTEFQDDSDHTRLLLRTWVRRDTAAR
ncbi:TauD/TfdA family dioxygenase [Streptomyces sp. NPDC056257]|uniref:TauD/TfdA family dioxygenase n=1 Tax=Streptomyces sp. NPDC056257 TaxID=3345765 RepID=UPI0035DF56F3